MDTQAVPQDDSLRTGARLPPGITDDDVRDALRRVLDGPEFRSSPRSSAFLRFVVGEALAGRGASLKERAIATAALGRGADFDSRTNPAVRVQARRVRDALDRHYEHDGVDDPLRIALPPGSYVPAFTRRSRPAAPTRGVTRGPGLLVTALRDLGGRGESRDLAAWLSELLVGELSRFPGIRVIGPARLPDDADILRSAAEFGAQFCLGGSVGRAGGVTRVIVGLTDTATGEVIWSRSFDQPDGAPAFQMEDEVVARVAAAIADYHGAVARALGRRPPRTTDPVAHEAMMLYHGVQADLDPERFEAVAAALEAAVAREPGNSLALAMLADVTMWAVAEELGDRPRTPEEAAELADRAVTLDPSNALGHVVLAWSARLQGRVKECHEHCARVVELTPNHPYHLLCAGIDLAYSGEWERGVELVRRSLSLNPDRPSWIHLILAFDHLRLDENREALEEGRRVRLPGLPLAPLVRAVALSRLGRIDEARTELDAVRTLVPGFDDDRDTALRSALLPEELRSEVIAALDAIGEAR